LKKNYLQSKNSELRNSNAPPVKKIQKKGRGNTPGDLKKRTENCLRIYYKKKDRAQRGRAGNWKK